MPDVTTQLATATETKQLKFTDGSMQIKTRYTWADATVTVVILQSGLPAQFGPSTMY